jgi:hypothetical protein
MSEIPKTPQDKDEFTKAREAKVGEKIIALAREIKKTAPVPKDVNEPQEDAPINTSRVTCAVPTGKVFQFREYQSKQAREDSVCRGYGRFKADHYRRMQERDEKRKRQEVPKDEQADQ